MRTSVRLNPELLSEAKRLADGSNRTLTSFIEDALRDALARRRAMAPSSPLPLPTFKGRGVRPGIDLDRTSALLDLMD